MYQPEDDDESSFVKSKPQELHQKQHVQHTKSREEHVDELTQAQILEQQKKQLRLAELLEAMTQKRDLMDKSKKEEYDESVQLKRQKELRKKIIANETGKQRVARLNIEEIIRMNKEMAMSQIKSQRDLEIERAQIERAQIKRQCTFPKKFEQLARSPESLAAGGRKFINPGEYWIMSKHFDANLVPFYTYEFGHNEACAQTCRNDSYNKK